MLERCKAESVYHEAAAREFPSFESALTWLQEEYPGGVATYRENDPGVMDYGARGNRATCWTVRRLPVKEKSMGQIRQELLEMKEYLTGVLAAIGEDPQQSCSRRFAAVTDVLVKVIEAAGAAGRAIGRGRCPEDEELRYKSRPPRTSRRDGISDLECDNCGTAFSAENELDHVFPNIPDLVSRLDPGGIVPSGTCPACGSLVYVTAETRVAGANDLFGGEASHPRLPPSSTRMRPGKPERR